MNFQLIVYIAPYLPREGFARVIHNLTPRN